MSNPTDLNKQLGNQGQNDDQATQEKQDQQAYISGGVPEAPVTIDSQEVARPVEYGYEVLRKMEEGSVETALEAAERKETKRLEDPKQQQQKVQKRPKQPSAQTPKYFGYNIPPQIANNFKLISRNKGGDPASSRTWIFVLLDKMLRMRAVK